MHRSLHWKDVGIEEKLERLHIWVIQSLQKAPPARSSEREKFTQWGENLQEFRRKIVVIRERVLPSLSGISGIPLSQGRYFFLPCSNRVPGTFSLRLRSTSKGEAPVH